MRKYHCIDYVEFGKRIARQRKRLGISQRQLAERLDCNESYIITSSFNYQTPKMDFPLFYKRTKYKISYY